MPSTRGMYQTQNLYDVSQKLFGVVSERQAAGGVDRIGLSTGYTDLDDVLGGWRNKELYAVGGVTGSGKSAFCLSAGLHVARQGKSVFYLSLEMSAEILALRTLSAMTQIPAMKIEKGQLSTESLNRLGYAVETFQDLPIFFYDRSTNSETLADILELQEKDSGLDLAIIDYIALLQDKGNSPYERVTSISINLKKHATDFDIPILVVSQLNRSALNREGGRPILQDLKETGQIENDAGAVIFPFRPKVDEDEQGQPFERAELIIAKNRHGPSNVTIPAEFVPKQMVWREPDYEVIDPTREVENA